MRVKKIFGVRSVTKAESEPRKKYFLVYEGEKTELLYFDAVNDMRQEISLNPLIELTPLIRSYSESGWSNPKQILDRVIQNVTEGQTGDITYGTLIDRVIDYLLEKEIISKTLQAKNIASILEWYCAEENKTRRDLVTNLEQTSAIIAGFLDKASCIATISENISDIIKSQAITYAEDFDKICLIVDRDRESFICKLDNDQYNYVLETCKKKKMGFYVTNPCFEFWLLLHFDQVLNLDKTRLLNNPKVSSRRRYAEHELNKLMPGFQKSSYDAHLLVQKIDTAIENAQQFCEEIEKLEQQVGCNLGRLIKELRE
nr:RloB family protein [Acetobacterium dehalogenans]